MPVTKIVETSFSGINTRAPSTGLPLLECVDLREFRVVGKDLVQRKGMVRVNQMTGNQTALTFTAASSMALSNAVDSRVWKLGLYWTVEVAFQLTSASGTQGLVTAGHTTPSLMLDVTGGSIRCRAWDSAGTATTITVGTASTSVATVQVTRSGATLSTRLNNATAVTGSMSATLLGRTPVGDLRVMQDDGSNFGGGVFDKLDVFSIVKTDHNDRLVRLAAPRAGHVLASYDMNLEAGPLVYDRSRYGNHLIAANTPVEATSLCWNPAPVRGLSMMNDPSVNRKTLLVMAGGANYVANVD